MSCVPLCSTCCPDEPVVGHHLACPPWRGGALFHPRHLVPVCPSGLAIRHAGCLTRVRCLASRRPINQHAPSFVTCKRRCSRTQRDDATPSNLSCVHLFGHDQRARSAEREGVGAAAAGGADGLPPGVAQTSNSGHQLLPPPALTNVPCLRFGPRAEDGRAGLADGVDQVRSISGHGPRDGIYT